MLNIISAAWTPFDIYAIFLIYYCQSLDYIVGCIFHEKYPHLYY